MGRFEADYVGRFPCAVVRKQGEIVAFANLWPGAEKFELSVDLMRYGAGAPKGVMDYLFIEILLYAKQRKLRLVQSRHGAAVGAGAPPAGAVLAQAGPAGASLRRVPLQF